MFQAFRMKTIFKYFLACLICFISCAQIQAQQYSIIGNAPFFKGKQIRLYIISDYITKQPLLVDSDIINKKGVFALSISLKNIVTAQISIEYYSSTFFLEPNKSYNIFVDSLSKNNNNEQQNSFINPLPLNIRFEKIQKNDINYLVENYNQYYDDFIYKHFEYIYIRPKKSYIDTLKAESQKEIVKYKNDFFKNYVNYKIALLELAARSKSRKQLAQKYLCNVPVQHYNPAYMDFFNEYFSGSFTNGLKGVGYYDIRNAINDSIGYARFNDILGKDTILRNETLRELLIIKGLGEIFNDPTINRNEIVKYLNVIQNTSRQQHHKIIAKMQLRNLMQLEKGSYIPPFNLKTIEGKYIKSDSLKGKFVYLCFFTSWDKKSASYVEIINKMLDEFKSQVNFVFISTDRYFINFSNFVSATKPQFPIMHFDYNYTLLDDFHIKVIPSCILIDKNGTLYDYYAPSPDAGLEMYLKKILSTK